MSMYVLECGKTIEERAWVFYTFMKMKAGCNKELTLMNSKMHRNPVKNAIFSMVPEMETFDEEDLPDFSSFLKSFKEFAPVATSGVLQLDSAGQKRVTIGLLNGEQDVLVNFIFDATKAEVDSFFASFWEAFEVK